MAELQPLSSIIPLAAIERPACPKCQAQMSLARIVPAFLGTNLLTFECAVCNHVLKRLARMKSLCNSRNSDAAFKAICDHSIKSIKIV
jgi:hypothetical protein